jgi:hypothetical protein
VGSARRDSALILVLLGRGMFPARIGDEHWEPAELPSASGRPRGDDKGSRLRAPEPERGAPSALVNPGR